MKATNRYTYSTVRCGRRVATIEGANPAGGTFLVYLTKNDEEPEYVGSYETRKAAEAAQLNAVTA